MRPTIESQLRSFGEDLVERDRSGEFSATRALSEPTPAVHHRGRWLLAAALVVFVAGLAAVAIGTAGRHSQPAVTEPTTPDQVDPSRPSVSATPPSTTETTLAPAGTPSIADPAAKVAAGTPVPLDGFTLGDYGNGLEPLGAGIYAFASPSGNIMCTGGALEVTCETKEGAVENQPLTIPDDEASCPLAVDRRAVAISRGSVFHGQCTGGVIVPFAAATLDYGTSLHFGEVTCLSDQEAVICLDDASETGFTLSRAGYTAFGVGGS